MSAKDLLEDCQMSRMVNPVVVLNLVLDGFSDILQGQVNCFNQQPLEVVLL